MDNKETRALTVKDVQERLQIGKSTANALFHQQNFPSFRLNRRMLISETKFNEWLDAQTK